MFGGCVSGFGWLNGFGGIVLWIGLLLLYFSGEFILHGVGGWVCLCLFICVGLVDLVLVGLVVLGCLLVLVFGFG